MSSAESFDSSAVRRWRVSRSFCASGVRSFARLTNGSFRRARSSAVLPMAFASPSVVFSVVAANHSSTSRLTFWSLLSPLRRSSIGAMRWSFGSWAASVRAFARNSRSAGSW